MICMIILYILYIYIYIILKGKNMDYKVFTIWLFLVTLWNFGVPDASPLEDVLVAIVLSFLSIILKKYTRL